MWCTFVYRLAKEDSVAVGDPLLTGSTAASRPSPLACWAIL